MNHFTKYEDTMPAEIIEMSAEGKSPVQIAAYWKVSEDTIKQWAKDLTKPEFGEAYKIAKTCFEGYWEDVGQKGIKGLNPKFNAAAWQKVMSSRCSENWKESTTQKIELKNEVSSMSTEEIDEAIKVLLAQRKVNTGNNSSGTPVVNP